MPNKDYELLINNIGGDKDKKATTNTTTKSDYDLIVTQKNATLIDPIIRDLGSMPIYGKHPLYNAIPDPTGTFDNLKLARNQSPGQQFVRFLGQSLTTIGGETLVGLGATYEIFKNLATEDNDFNNLLIEGGKRLQEWGRETMPIHRMRPNKTFDFSDFGWWADNATSIASAIGMLIPAAGQVRALGYLVKLGQITRRAALIRGIFSTSVLNTGKASKFVTMLTAIPELGYMQKQLGKAFLTAGIMRNAENVSESYETFRDVKAMMQEELDIKKMSDEDFIKWKEEHPMLSDKERKMNREDLSNSIAGTAAWDTYKTNSVNFVFDLIQVMPLFRPFKHKVNVASISKKLAAAQSESIGTETQVLTKGARRLARSKAFGLFALETGTEGIEEFINAVGSAEGLYYAKRVLGKTEDKEFSERLNTYLEDPHAWEQAFWGTIGGGVFQGITKVAPKVSDLVKGVKDRTNTNIRLAEIESRAIMISKLGALQKASNEGFRIYNEDGSYNFESKEKFEGSEEEIKEAIKRQNDLLANDFITELGFNAASVGNFNMLIEYLNSDKVKKQLKDSGVAEEEINNTISKIKSGTEKVAKLYSDYYNSVFNKPFNDYVKDVVIRGAVRNQLRAEEFKTQANNIAAKIADLKTNNPLYQAYKDAGIDNIIEYYSLLTTIAELEKTAKSTDNSSYREIIKHQTDKLINKLNERLVITKDLINNDENTKLLLQNESLVPSLKTLIGLQTQAYLLNNSGELRNALSADALATNRQYEEVSSELKKEAEAKRKELFAKYEEEIGKVSLSTPNWEEALNTIESQLKEIKKKQGTNIKSIQDLINKKRKQLKNEEHYNKRNNITPTPTSAAASGTNVPTTQPINTNSSTSTASPDATAAVDKLTEEEKTKYNNIIDSTTEQANNQIENLKSFGEAVNENTFNDNFKSLIIDTINNLKKDPRNNNLVDALNEYISNLENKNKQSSEEEFDENVTQDPLMKFNQIEENGEEELSFVPGLNLYLRPVDKINQNNRNTDGFIVLNEEETKIFNKINSVSEGNKVTIKIDQNNELYKSQSTDKDNVPIGVYIEDTLIGYLNEIDYLSREIQHMNAVNTLLESDDQFKQDIETLIKNRLNNQPLDKKAAKRIKEHQELDKPYRRKENESGELTNRELNMMLNKLSYGLNKINFNFDSVDIQKSLENWIEKIKHELEINKQIRNGINANPTNFIVASITYKTSGNTLIARTKDKNVVLHNVADIMPFDDIVLYGASTTNKKQLVTIDGTALDSIFGKNPFSYGNEYLAVPMPDGNYAYAPLIRTTLSGMPFAKANNKFVTKFDNSYNEKLKKHVYKRIVELVTLLQNNPNIDFNDNRITTIKDELAKLIVVNLRNNEPNTWFKFYNAVNDSSARVEIKSGDKILIFYSDGKGGVNVQIQGNKKTLKENEVLDYMGGIARNVDRKLLQDADIYKDPVTGKEYNSYKEFIIETNAFVTDLGKVIDNDGKTIGYTTTTNENNNYREAGRPLIINIEPDSSTEKNATNSIVLHAESNGNITDGMKILKGSKTEIELAQIADKLGIKLTYKPYTNVNVDSNTIDINGIDIEVPKTAPAAFYGTNNEIFIFDFLEQSVLRTAKSKILTHEIIHGIAKNYGFIVSDKLNNYRDGLIKHWGSLTKTKKNNLANTISNITGQTKEQVLAQLKLIHEEIADTEELITYAFTDDVFTTYLQLTKAEGVKTETKNTLLNKFKELVSEILTEIAKSFNIEFSKLDELNQILDEVFELTNQQNVQTGSKTIDNLKFAKQVDFVFESNPELANAVYEALGFNNIFKNKILNGFHWYDYEGNTYSKDNFDEEIAKQDKLKPNNVVKIEYKQTDTPAGDMFNVFYVDSIKAAEILNKYGITKSVEDFIKESLNEVFKGNEKLAIDELYGKQTIPLQQKQQAQQLYSEYLDTIFPDSKVKDIVYHYTDAKKFDKFVKDYIGSSVERTGVNAADSELGIFFGKKGLEGVANKEKLGTTEIPALINIKNPNNDIYDKADEYLYSSERFIDEQVPDYDIEIEEDENGNIKTVYKEKDKLKGKDLERAWYNSYKKDLIAQGKDGVVLDNIKIVFEPEQIHILGSKQDIEQFKNWVDSNQSNVQYQLPQGREQEEFVASEKTIRDLAARMSDRADTNNKNFNKTLQNTNNLIKFVKVAGITAYEFNELKRIGRKYNMNQVGNFPFNVNTYQLKKEVVAIGNPNISIGKNNYGNGFIFFTYKGKFINPFTKDIGNLNHVTNIYKNSRNIDDSDIDDRINKCK